MKLLLPIALLFVACNPTPSTPVVSSSGCDPLDKASAGCCSPKGEWRCHNLPTPAAKPVIFASGGARPPITPASWNVHAWAFDPANTSGCASDGNNCQATSCSGGAGPCVTFGEIAARWGQLDPLLTTDGLPITITQMSSQSIAQQIADPIELIMRLGGSASDAGVNAGTTLTFQCTLPTPTNTTITNVNTAKNRSTPTDFRITVGAGGGVGNLYCNSIRTCSGTSSCAWGQAAGAGGSTRLTQPTCLSGGTASFVSTPFANEINTWANGDALFIYAGTSLVKSRIMRVRPRALSMLNNESGMVIVQNCNMVNVLAIDGGSTPENASDATIDIGRNVVLLDGSSAPVVSVDAVYSQSNGTGQGSVDWWYAGGFTGGFRGSEPKQGLVGIVGYWQMIGGMVNGNGGSTIALSTFNGAWLDGDIILSNGTGPFVFTGTNHIGVMELNDTMEIVQGVVDVQTSTLYNAVPIVWTVQGTGNINAVGGTVFYPVGATGCATTFPNASGGATHLQYAGGTTACKYPVTAAAPVCNTTLTTAANVDTALGATLGQCCAGAVGCFSNGPF